MVGQKIIQNYDTIDHYTVSKVTEFLNHLILIWILIYLICRVDLAETVPWTRLLRYIPTPPETNLSGPFRSPLSPSRRVPFPRGSTQILGRLPSRLHPSGRSERVVGLRFTPDPDISCRGHFPFSPLRSTLSATLPFSQNLQRTSTLVYIKLLLLLLGSQHLQFL